MTDSQIHVTLTPAEWKSIAGTNVISGSYNHRFLELPSLIIIPTIIRRGKEQREMNTYLLLYKAIRKRVLIFLYMRRYKLINTF